MTPEELHFVEAQRVAHLATADGDAQPSVVPVCYVLHGDALYVAIDGKPKSGRKLKRVANIEANPQVSLVVDRYDEDWRRLGWVLLRGRAEILTTGIEHDAAIAHLRERYPPYRDMDLAAAPVIAMRVETVTSWGDLGP